MANAAEATMTASSGPDTTSDADTAVDSAAEEQAAAQTEAATETTNDTANDTAAAGATKPIRFTGTPRTMVAGVAMLISSVMAFTMGLTDVFFAEAMAWTFAIWGGLLIYAGMLDSFRVYEVHENALLIKDDFRPWGRLKTWDWERLNRLDIVVKKAGAQSKDLEMQIYYNPEGELAMEREDRIYDAELARLIIERAELNPAERTNPSDLTKIPTGEKQTFSWR